MDDNHEREVARGWGELADEIPECCNCGDRWVDRDAHWRWEPLYPDADDLEPGESLDDPPVFAWFCETCWTQEFGS